MPLPAALAARLAKRGLIQEQPAPPTQSKQAEEVEEVFAEDYDDLSKPEVPEEETHTKVPQEEPPETEKEIDDTEYIHEVTACPNRWNPYHTCVKHCKNRWGMKTFAAEPEMLRKRERMLRKYPLPDGWKEVADPDSGRYYYWSMQTDQVCWLSPGHPSAIISAPAEILTGTLAANLDEDFEDQEEMEPVEDEPMEAESDMSGSSSESDSEGERRRAPPRREPDPPRQGRSGQGRSGRYQDDRRGRRGGGRSRRDDIDPMDPAAYSDIPRGGWTDGLDTRGAAKTGVDSTASGPLFQQRPYPSPGDILRANQQLKK
ncbi:polyglutamine-binding protein 1-like [Littorina saxatilis]|uniref:Polyglutamine-binding protein 1 n=1 Tax=Littorina saxatilis TaxID=31220 RepID=A0AAN9GC71_9CAEN